jgi:hypothetical protein
VVSATLRPLHLRELLVYAAVVTDFSKELPASVFLAVEEKYYSDYHEHESGNLLHNIGNKIRISRMSYQIFYF